MSLRGVIGAAVLLACTQAPAMAGTSAEAEWHHQFELASQHHAQGGYAEAEQAANLALRQARAGQGRTQPYVASSLNLLALIRLALGRPEDAAALLREALALNEQSLGMHPNTLAVAMNLGRALEASGRLQEATGLYEHGLALADTLHARTPDDEAVQRWRQQALSALAQAHAQLGQAGKAQHYNQRLLDTPAASAAVQVAALTRQAQALQAEGRQDEAMALHRQAIVLRQADDPSDPRLAMHYNALALWHAEHRDDAAAQAWFDKALAVVRSGSDDTVQQLAAARILGSLAQLDERRGRHTDARRRYEESLRHYSGLGETTEAWLGRAHVLNQLAGLDVERKRLTEAEQRYLQALQWLERAVGTDDPRLLPVLDKLAAYYTGRGQPHQAQRHARRAIELRRAHADSTR